MRTSTLLVLTFLTLVAFASNSLLCRMALLPDAIDAASFTALRVVAGALALSPLLVRSLRANSARPPWRSALALFAYAIAFSFAYTSLTTGTGALLLFGSVQVTMIGAALVAGERPRALEWIGGVLALVGLVWLVLPGVSAPPLVGAALMIVAGIAWGVYSLLGRAPASSGRTPSHDTAWSFARATPLALAVFLAMLFVPSSHASHASVHITTTGALLAIASGALTSGLGYVLWYAVLRGHTATSAALVQLAVPVLAAFAGVVVLDEHVTARLLVAAALVVGGVALAVAGRRR